MLKQFITLMFLCVISIVYAQEPKENYTLNSTETGTKNYVARDYISLKNGFSYKAGEGLTFTALIDPCLLFPPTDATYKTERGEITTDPAQGGVVGSIPGQFNLSSTGAATYTIPIECPKGIKGLQPNISLVYNSQSGNGIAGWGWSISGLSQITRAPRTYYYDRQASSIDWTKDSPLMLDGQRLMKISETSSQIEYKTESESFSRIIGKNIASWGPKIIEVTTKEGKVLTFGVSSSNDPSHCPLSIGTSGDYARLSWFLTKVQDSNGNYIEYNYSMNEYSINGSPAYGNHRIAYISYGGNINKGSSHYAKIHFDYEGREDDEEMYIGGQLIRKNYRIKNITVSSNSTQLFNYELTYEQNLQSNLVSVQLTGQKNESYNVTNFKYPSRGLNNKVGEEYVSLLEETIEDKDLFYRDFNKDGRTDFITVEDDIVTLYLNTIENGKVVFKNKCTKTIYGSDIKYVVPADLNGDGYVDLVGVSNAYKSYRYNYYFFDGNEFSKGNSSGYTGFNTTEKSNDFKIADYNGDGKDEILIKSTNSVYNGNGSKIGSGGIDGFGDSKVLNCNINTGNNFNCDVTGNGKENLISAMNNSLDVYELTGSSFTKVFSTQEANSNDALILGDYNGDNLTDILVQRRMTSNNWSWYILFSTGNSFVKKDIKNYELRESYTTATKAVNLNMDGKSDIIMTTVYDKGNGKLFFDFKAGVWNGKGFDFVSYKSDIYSSGYLHQDVLDLCFSDFDGDGVTEVCYSGGTVYREIKSFDDNTKLFVYSIEGGLDDNITFDYDLMTTNYGCYNEYASLITNYPIIQQRFPLVLLHSHQKEGASKIYYDYYDLLIHKQGKGLLGFLSTESTNYKTNIKVRSYNNLNTAYNILIPDHKETRCGIQTISKETYDYTTVYKGNKRFWLKNNSITTLNGLTETSVKQKFISYDSYGNPTSVSKEYLHNGTSSGISEEQTISYTDEGSWCDYLPLSTTITKKNSEGNESRTTNFTYDSKGNILTKTQDPGDDNELVTRYSNYDSFGNAKNIKTESNDKVRGVTLTYTSSGRFTNTKTEDYTGFKTTYNYNETTGLLDYEVDHLGHKTQYEYDGFGRLSKSTYPDGTYSVQTLQWNDGSGPADAVYCSYAETSGQSPVWTWYDNLGREVRTDSYGFKKDKVIEVVTDYNSKGEKWHVSEPHFNGESYNNTTYSYDNYGRLNTVVSQLGTVSYVYDDANLKTTVTSPNGTSTEIKNAAGQVIESSVDSKKVSFTYWPNGQVKTSTPEGGIAVETYFDLQGNRTKIIDPDAGTISSKYNGFGELVWEEYEKKESDGSLKTIRTENSYDDAGRNYSSTQNGVTTTTVFDTSKGFVNSVTNSETGHKVEYNYDGLGRVTKYTESINGKSFPFYTTYDSFGREKTRTYPSGFAITNTYTKTGFLEQVKDKSGNNIWKGEAVNARGQFKQCLKGDKTIAFGYEPERGLPESIQSGDIIDMFYQYYADGNLEYRQDLISGNKESFTYNLNRLETWKIERDNLSNPVNYTIGYGDHGNITSKSDLGYAMNYDDATKIHAITSISGNPSIISDVEQVITYNDFKKVSTITEGNHTLKLTYGIDNQRRVGVFNEGKSDAFTKYYMGDYEEDHSDGSVKKVHYIAGGNGLAAIYIEKDGVGNLYHAYTDFQGSLLALTDKNGSVVERYAYDPWGKRRDPESWEDADSRTTWLTDRGYTFHEHLDNFALINMNGRVYDSVIARFLSPDPQLQAPGNWLNYNRYTYCMNNPMLYTDPSGEFWNILAGAIIGSVIGTLSSNIKSIRNGDSFGQAMWDGFVAGHIGGLAGAAAAATGGAVSGGLSTATSLGGSVLNGAAVGSAGGFAGGFVGSAGNAWVNGADFGGGLSQGLIGGASGAISGAVIGGITQGIDFLHNKYVFNKYLNITDDGVAMDGRTVSFSNDNLKSFSDSYFGDQEGCNSLTAVDHFSDGAAGKTIAIGQDGVGQMSNVKIAMRSFKSKFSLYNTLGHEYVHVAQRYAGLLTYANFMEAGAYSWNKYVYSQANKNLPISYSIQLNTNLGMCSNLNCGFINSGYSPLNVQDYMWFNLSTFRFNPY